MIQFIAKPEQTFALVVGIAKYQESSWNVKSGATVEDALKFFYWLQERGVPKENIKLCLSPLEEHQQKNQKLLESCGLSVEEPKLENIDKIITNVLSQKMGDLLYIFWAGHGLITAERERRLFCADVTKQNWQNIDLNSLLRLLSSDSFQIRNHICIIDACANYILETQGRPTNLGGKDFHSGKPRTDSQQFVLLATKEGEKAKVNAETETGYFSQAVLSELEQEPSENFPPDMKAITDKVKQRFERLEKKQLPTYFYYRSWDGDVERNYFNPSEICHNIPNSQARKFVDRHQPLESLHQLLQKNSIVAITDVTGLGGVGKTELAIQYSWQHLEDYPGGCCWINTLQHDIVTALSEFAYLNSFPGFNLPEKLTLASQVSYCWRNWQPGNVLLVFDNVTDIEQIKPYLPNKGSQFKVLITTRRSDLTFESLPLGGLPETAALELLKKLLEHKSVKLDSENAKVIFDILGCNPLQLYILAGQSLYGQ